VELLMVAAFYTGYDAVRGVIRGASTAAERHGADLLHWEQLFGIAPEHDLNDIFARLAVIAVPACFFYASMHFVITPGVLIWAHWRHPEAYRRSRTVLGVVTAAALIGFWLYPTAPPRLLAGAGFQDTVAHYSDWGWWAAQDSAPRGLTSLANQFAAMPSLHVAWALWCGITIYRLAAHRGPKLLGLAYPAVTVLVVIGTANHYLLDAIAGALLWWAADAVIGALTTITPTGHATAGQDHPGRQDVTSPGPAGPTPPR